jgi:hypothetical protein
MCAHQLTSLCACQLACHSTHVDVCLSVLLICLLPCSVCFLACSICHSACLLTSSVCLLAMLIFSNCLSACPLASSVCPLAEMVSLIGLLACSVCNCVFAVCNWVFADGSICPLATLICSICLLACHSASSVYPSVEKVSLICPSAYSVCNWVFADASIGSVSFVHDTLLGFGEGKGKSQYSLIIAFTSRVVSANVATRRAFCIAVSGLATVAVVDGNHGLGPSASDVIFHEAHCGRQRLLNRTCGRKVGIICT